MSVVQICLRYRVVVRKFEWFYGDQIPQYPVLFNDKSNDVLLVSGGLQDSSNFDERFSSSWMLRDSSISEESIKQ